MVSSRGTLTRCVVVTRKLLASYCGASSAPVGARGAWPKRTKLEKQHNRGFPKIDHSGIDARIVLEQNKFSKKATSKRT